MERRGVGRGNKKGGVAIEFERGGEGSFQKKFQKAVEGMAPHAPTAVQGRRNLPSRTPRGK